MRILSTSNCESASIRLYPPQMKPASSMKNILASLLSMGLALVLGSCTLSLEEKFNHYDLNGDGKVSQDEYAEVVTRITFGAFDEDEDGSVTLAEWQKLEGAESDPQFKVHDLDGNGSVTLEEALRSTRKKKSFSEAFPGIDTDRDGYVVLSEAQAYAAKARAALRQSTPQ